MSQCCLSRDKIENHTTTTGWSHPPGFTSGGLGVEQMTSPPNATAHSSANEGVMVRSDLSIHTSLFELELLIVIFFSVLILT